MRVEIPSVLAQVVEGRRALEAEGATLEQALVDLVRRHPALAVHLFDETGGFRRHVLCFLNETSTRWMAGLEHPIAEGDTITILQAVSGG